VAVVGLLVFLTGGGLFLRHVMRKDDEPIRLETAPTSTASGNGGLRSLGFGEGVLPGRILDADDAKDSDEFRLLARTDPLAAAATLGRIEDSPLRDERLYDLMVIWTEIDPRQAADWVVNLPIGSLKTDATAELGLSWGTADPESAARWVEENIFTENAPAGAASLTSVWARSDPDSAAEWVASLDTETPARREAIKALAEKLGALDSQRGLAWLGQLSSQDRNLVALQFVTSWSSIDPEAAANWLRSGSANLNAKTRDVTTLSLIHSWTSVNPESASQWIIAISDSDLKEDAKAAFAETHVDDSPPEALSWAQSIVDLDRRFEVSMNVYEDWVIDNREDFKAALREDWEGLNQRTRHGIYDLLIDHDPDFKKELFLLLDDQPGE